jgi:hypothetical protein
MTVVTSHHPQDDFQQMDAVGRTRPQVGLCTSVETTESVLPCIILSRVLVVLCAMYSLSHAFCEPGACHGAGLVSHGAERSAFCSISEKGLCIHNKCMSAFSIRLPGHEAKAAAMQAQAMVMNFRATRHASVTRTGSSTQRSVGDVMVPHIAQKSKFATPDVMLPATH